MRKPFLWKVALNALGLWIVTEFLVAGMRVENVPALLVAALVLGLINATVRPILILLSLPFNVLTLGLLTLVINGAMLSLAASIVPGFYIATFWTAVWGAILLSIISAVLDSF
ncbi:MAG: phage holin family protein [Firmicutes bacterium]|nr:phage holin family protein [Dethiobacter sp.]MBS3888168.1 phage holin family protein [Bacillota bacterium]